jgi:uncharacterized membrane protein YdbT with pleckstrin-like domain
MQQALEAEIAIATWKPSNWQFAISLMGWVQVVLVLPFLYRLAANRFETYELTDRRIRIIKGLIFRQEGEIELSSIRDVDAERDLLQRLFGVGDLFIRSSEPTSPVHRIPCVPNAKAIREKIQAAVERAQSRRGADGVDVG